MSTDKTKENYKHSELTEAIIGAFYEVYNELGFGFLESVYRKSLALVLSAKCEKVCQEVSISVHFRGINVVISELIWW
jgi:GxxExxY protein